MALKPTIYKFSIDLADSDRERYDALSLTVAQHPSETLERMMVRVLAFCLNADESLSFTKGLSEPDVPDIEGRSLDGVLRTWIDIGEPSAERLKKASRIAKSVTVYSFNSKSNTWWTLDKDALQASGAEFYQIAWGDAQAMASMVERTLDLSVAITGGTVYLNSDTHSHQITLLALA